MIRTMLTLLLAIFWLPVSSHCLLMEVTSGFESISCCAHSDSENPPASHQDDCATDACAIVEGAQYKSSLQRVTVPVLDNHVLFELPAPQLTRLPLAVISPHSPDDTLASLPVAWQFAARTALPPRAPSFVS